MISKELMRILTILLTIQILNTYSNCCKKCCCCCKNKNKNTFSNSSNNQTKHTDINTNKNKNTNKNTNTNSDTNLDLDLMKLMQPTQNLNNIEMAAQVQKENLKQQMEEYIKNTSNSNPEPKQDEFNQKTKIEKKTNIKNNNIKNKDPHYTDKYIYNIKKAINKNIDKIHKDAEVLKNKRNIENTKNIADFNSNCKTNKKDDDIYNNNYIFVYPNYIPDYFYAHTNANEENCLKINILNGNKFETRLFNYNIINYIKCYKIYLVIDDKQQHISIATANWNNFGPILLHSQNNTTMLNTNYKPWFDALIGDNTGKYDIEVYHTNYNNPTMIKMTKKKYSYQQNGLTNEGSTCYMNATLQCLFHIDDLENYFLEQYPIYYDNLRQKNKDSESEGDISAAFYNLIKAKHDKMNNNTKKNENYVSPLDFKNILGFHNPQFKKFEANDAKDLILYLLQTMHEELNYFGDNPQSKLPFPNQFDRVNTFNYFMNTYNNHNFSIISNIFYGTYENQTQCKKCQKILYNFQKFEFVSFGMCGYDNKVFDIYNGFEDNQKTQPLYGDNQFYCNNCNSLQDATITSKIIQAPNKLLINIDYGKGKRFKPSKIKFDEIIDITKYVNFNFGMNIRYQLTGVVTHLGKSGESGHYIAYCKNKDTDKWYKFNDSKCNECSKDDIYRGSPYLLIYERI